MYIDTHGKKWFKGNLHTHTTNSDGRKSPDECIALYESNGYDFLAITDHWKLSSTAYTAKGMLLLSGIEYNFNGGDVLAGVFHILGLGQTGTPDDLREADAQTCINSIHAHGGYAVLAHPSWSMDTAEQILTLHDIDATEIFNSVSDVPHNCRPYSGEVIDQLTVRGMALPCIADDDSHFYDGEATRSYIWVQADCLTREAILEALRAGRFYATQGPQLDWTITENPGEKTKTIHLNLREEDHVTMVIKFSGSVWAGGRCVEGDPVTECDLVLRESDRFFRPEIVASDGKRAWMSPVTLC